MKKIKGFEYFRKALYDMSESTFASLTMEKTVGVPGAWSKRVEPIFLMSHGCVLDITCNKPIRVSNPIPFKRQLCLHHGGFAIYMAEFAREKTERFSREETDLLKQEVKVYIIIIFYIVIL